MSNNPLLSKKIKIMTIVGTRPEVIKLSRIIAELQRYVQHILVHTGQNHDYELNQIFFKQLKLQKPDYFLEAVGTTTAETIGNIIAKSDDIIAREKPNALLLLGDTNSCLSAIPAKRRKIPIFHLEAGNRCFDQNVPEEINRKIVDHISDINLPYSEHARRYLIAEGIRPETIIKTGSPMKEVLKYYRADIETSDILQKLKLNHRKYFVVSAHREENIDSDANFHNLLCSLNTIAETYDMPVVISTHPRTRKRIESLQTSFELDKRISILKPMGFPDYVCLQAKAFCVVSDSGTITEESSIMNFPAVTIRQTHERPEGMDEGTVIMCGLNSERVLQSIEVVTKQFDPNVRTFRLVSDYESENISKKVLRIIIGYIDYVNRTVWYKHV
jgi:UDP-N-acetylglucosamine 2-epimerase (non-hydrolysing)